MNIKSALLICTLAIFMGQSCRMAEVLAGGERAGTVDRLWADVPPIDGAKKADLAIPLGARLLIRTVTAGNVNFIAFTSERTAEDVKNYYSNERMKAAGWEAGELGCVTDAESGPTQGAVCFFVRPHAADQNALAIVIAQDPELGETHIFYVRIDVPQEELRRQERQGSARS